MVKQTNDNFVTAVTEKETLEFFREGLRQASSSARQLSDLQQHPIWKDVSILLDEIHNKGMQLATSKSLSRQTTLAMIDRKQKISSDKLDETRPKTPKFIIN